MKYWDPQASSVKKFVDLGLGTAEQYTFSALSNKLLGQAQPKQFQSYGDEQPTGWWWGSKCTPIYDESNPPKVINTMCDSSASVANNILSEIPRGYARSGNAPGNLYNWYAATAESGKFDMLSTSSSRVAQDSVCPSGWGLPIASGSKSWSYLASTYGVSASAGGSLLSRSMPLAIPYPGSYLPQGNLLYENTAVRSWMSSESNSNSLEARQMDANMNIISTGGTISKVYGASIHCVKK